MQSTALAIVRVGRGAPRPDDEALRAALRAACGRGDRSGATVSELVAAGPYAVSIDGRELDEYVVWER